MDTKTLIRKLKNVIILIQLIELWRSFTKVNKKKEKTKKKEK